MREKVLKDINGSGRDLKNGANLNKEKQLKSNDAVPVEQKLVPEIKVREDIKSTLASNVRSA